MTLKELIANVPLEYHDSAIKVYIPCIRAGDEDDYLLTQVSFDQTDSNETVIVLTAEFY